MKRLLFFCVLTIFSVFPVVAQPAITGSEGKPVGLIDTRGLDNYIEIAETFQKGEQPTETQWNSLFATTYFYLAIKQFKFINPEKFKEEMGLVYKPNSILNDEQKKKFKQHLQYQENLIQLKQYSLNIKDGSIRKEISRYLFPYLPKRLRNIESIPPMVYTYYHVQEANGFQDLLLFDGMLAYQTDKYRRGVLAAHEAFHSICYQEINKRLIAISPTDDRSMILTVLRGYAGEGIADLIDKEIFARKDSPVYEIFTTLFFKDEEKNSRKYIQEFDKELIALSNGQKIPDVARFRQRVSGFGGHHPGRMMGKIIREGGLLKEVINDVENPFPFIYAYNKAAIKLKKDFPVFSKDAIAYLKKIESEVIKPIE